MHTLPRRRQSLLGAALLVLATLVASTLPATTTASAAAAAAPGRVLHVSPNGRDTNNGSAGAPWQHLDTAMGRLQAGDTLLVAPGTYGDGNGDGVIRPRLQAGTADARITVKATGPDVFLSVPLGIDNAAYWTFDGLNVGGNGVVATGSRPQYLVKMLGGTGWVFRNAEICCYGTYGLVRIHGKPADWTFSHNLVYSNRGRGQGSDQDHIMYVETDRGAGPGYIERNILAGASNGANIKLGRDRQDNPDGGPTGVTIRRNTLVGAFNNVRVAFDTTAALIEDNITLGATLNWPNGPAAVQPYCLDGRGNVTRNDLWWGPPTVRHTDPIRGTYCTYRGQWVDQGGHVKRDPRIGVAPSGTFNQTRLRSLRPEQFVPGDAIARGYGRFSQFDQVLAGDWDGDGVDTPAGVLGNRVHLTDQATDAGTSGVAPGAGEAERILTFGRDGWQFVAGDWNGDGIDEIGAYDPATATLHQRFTANRTVAVKFGSNARRYQAYVGDWNGDRIDDLGLLDLTDKTFHLRNSATRTTSFKFGSGRIAYQPVAGDWDGNGRDELGLWQPSTRTFHLRACAEVTCTGAGTSFPVGSSSSAPFYQPVVGRWDRSSGPGHTVGVVLWNSWSRARGNDTTSGFWPTRSYDG
ncbi:hypothetical protein INN71_00555 [Nocardioides sp. ChNu-153]|uniref:hypothetical protein n=1 Tax=unclassified Nocardioides TaxID=2615069 RepID=UPI0024052677|nr:MULTISPECIES: hypothetical protein [unclassified Nocardioides]MDF9714589.1 hypothetical protein [Nocardioides sp. ChNu-99]MDN7119877.1 hypothetical protein [Nocardioides sp. ChNu-153]